MNLLMFIAQLFVSGIVPRGYNLMVQCNPEQTPGSECVCVCVCVVCVVCVVVVGGGPFFSQEKLPRGV